MCISGDIHSLEINFSDLVIPTSELYRSMGYGDATPDSETLEILDDFMCQVARIAKPKAMYKICDCNFQEDCVEVEGVEFEAGKTILRLLRNSQKMIVFVATAGVEVDNLIKEVHQRNNPIESFVLDAIGSTVVEAAGDYMQQTITNSIAPLKNTNRFSPGYCRWFVAEQHKLFSLLPTNPCGINLTDSSLMMPIKSISGFIGVGENVKTKEYGCTICNRTDCYLRRI